MFVAVKKDKIMYYRKACAEARLDSISNIT